MFLLVDVYSAVPSVHLGPGLINRHAATDETFTTRRIVYGNNNDIFLDTTTFVYYVCNPTITGLIEMSMTCGLRKFFDEWSNQIQVILGDEYRVMSMLDQYERYSFSISKECVIYNVQGQPIDRHLLGKGYYRMLIRIAEVRCEDGKAYLQVGIPQMIYRPEWHLVNGFTNSIITRKPGLYNASLEKIPD